MKKKSPENKYTHFGYEQIPEDDKSRRVADVFHGVADQYDLMNDLMSFGIHRLWKRYTLWLSQVKPGDKVLDLAGGTGDFSQQFSKHVGKMGQVYLADINYSMLQKGRDKLIDQGIINNVHYLQANAEELPFAANSFNCICIGFGLRNVTCIDKALQSMFNVLKPGGRLLILEFSHPVIPQLKPIYDAYSFSILPKLGKLIVNDEKSYKYLAESIRMHPNQEKLKNMMARAGFEDNEFFNLTGGIVALHCGYKY